MKFKILVEMSSHSINVIAKLLVPAILHHIRQRHKHISSDRPKTLPLAEYTTGFITSDV